jgi:hypothetical protein
MVYAPRTKVQRRRTSVAALQHMRENPSAPIVLEHLRFIWWSVS